MTNKVSQSVLPGATRKECREAQIGEQIKASLSELFANGFWYCRGCDSRCERVEGENGQPSHCDHCGSPNIVWNPPIWTRDVDVHDTQLIHPGEL
jgi:hypothetical protein